jgi:hypothetical protein
MSYRDDVDNWIRRTADSLVNTHGVTIREGMRQARELYDRQHPKRRKITMPPMRPLNPTAPAADVDHDQLERERRAALRRERTGEPTRIDTRTPIQRTFAKISEEYRRTYPTPNE